MYSKEQNEKLFAFFAIYNLEGEAIFNDFPCKRYQCFIGPRFN